MPSAQIPRVEMIGLMALSELEQPEYPWMGLMQSINPDSVTVAFRLALMHFAKVSRRLQMADVVKTADM